MPVKTEFGSVASNFVDDGQPLGRNALCAFDFSGSQRLAIRQVVATYIDTISAGIDAFSRLVIIQGHSPEQLGQIARAGVDADLENTYGIKVLVDLVGIDYATQITFEDPILTDLGVRTAILHMPPYDNVNGIYLDCVYTLSVLGYNPKDEERQEILPGLKGR